MKRPQKEDYKISLYYAADLDKYIDHLESNQVNLVQWVCEEMNIEMCSPSTVNAESLIDEFNNLKQ